MSERERATELLEVRDIFGERNMLRFFFNIAGVAKVPSLTAFA